MTEEKYYRMTQEELLESDFWITTAYKETNPDSSIPVFVPSYNSYDNILLCKLMGKDMWPCTFIVRKSQEEAYLKNEQIIASGHKILAVEDNLISSCAAVREFIQNYCIDNNIDYYITVDDDLVAAGFKIPYTTKKGDNCATIFKHIDIPKFIAMFYNMSLKAFEVDSHIAVIGMRTRGNMFPSAPGVIDRDVWLHPCGGSTRGFVCINTKRYKDCDIHFDIANGKLVHEDLDSLAQLVIKGYYWGTFEWMYLQDHGASTFAFESLAERASIQTQTMLDKYKAYDLFSVRETKFGGKSNKDEKFVHLDINGKKARDFLKSRYGIYPEKYISY